MNLIEQLGGYEKAKAFLNATSFTIDELIMMQRSGLRSQHVEKALLEYRRQHNIYEAGDLVVSKNGCELVSEITYLQGGLAKIKNEKFDHVYSLQDFRHATDEEIKAGKRLEVESEN